MKSFGIFLIIIGVIWAIIAFSASTTVSTGFGEVNNIGLMTDRQNHLIFSGLTILIGVILFGFGSASVRSSANSNISQGRTSCPFCAEDILVHFALKILDKKQKFASIAVRTFLNPQLIQI